jgi:ABC-type uncharacterized transport system auxiliary subunit
MKKLICILASAALLGACEQKTEVTPAAPPVDTKKAETNTTIVNPPATKTETGAKPAPNTETKTETKTETTTSSSPNP